MFNNNPFLNAEENRHNQICYEITQDRDELREYGEDVIGNPTCVQEVFLFGLHCLVGMPESYPAAVISLDSGGPGNHHVEYFCCMEDAREYWNEIRSLHYDCCQDQYQNQV